MVILCLSKHCKIAVLNRIWRHSILQLKSKSRSDEDTNLTGTACFDISYCFCSPNIKFMLLFISCFQETRPLPVAFIRRKKCCRLEVWTGNCASKSWSKISMYMMPDAINYHNLCCCYYVFNLLLSVQMNEQCSFFDAGKFDGLLLGTVMIL